MIFQYRAAGENFYHIAPQAKQILKYRAASETCLQYTTASEAFYNIASQVNIL